MTIQVEGTNDSSCLSKYSAVVRGYYQDEFLGYFVTKCPRRAPLIHLGYSVRAAIINSLVDEFLSFSSDTKQIVSLGAGFDTLFFKIKKKLPNENFLYFELDLPRVVKNKVNCIKKSNVLRQIIGEFVESEECLISSRYKLLAVDLRNIEAVEKLFNEHKLSRSTPTLFLSECAITYLEEDRSSALIKLASSFDNATFVTYEQINPDDVFGQVMTKHFSSLQSPLLSVAQYPKLQQQQERYINCGWQECSSISAIEAYNTLVPEPEWQRVVRLEPFDEWEEFYLKCVHYAVVIASRGCLQKWSRLCDDSFRSNVNSSCLRREITCELKDVGSTARYGHSLLRCGDRLVLVGGFGVRRDGTHGRVVHLTWLEWDGLGGGLSVSRETDAPRVASMYTTWTPLPASDESFIVYGGRRSPNDATFTTPLVITIQPDGGVTESPVVYEFDKPARWRHTAVIARWNNVETFIVFGGRTADVTLLSDTWMIPLHPEISQRKVTTISSSVGPCARFSHGCSVRHLESGCDEVWVTGGCGNSGPLGDVWCLDLATLQWQQLSTSMRPRFSHTTSTTDHSLVMVGGLNLSHDLQPTIAVLNLQSGVCTEYDPQMVQRSMMLVNHRHVVSPDGRSIWIIGGGGNCFSFGTYFNKKSAVIQLESLCIK